jgi:hypothetical protein
MALRLSCKITGVDTAIKKLQNFGQAVDLKAKRRVNGTAIDIAGYAKERCPVLKKPRKVNGQRYSGGHLRSTIHATVDPDNPLTATTIAGGQTPDGTDVKYAPWVENGHDVKRGGRVVGHAPAQPFMGPAAQRGSQEFPDKLKKDVQDAIDEVSI